MSKEIFDISTKEKIGFSPSGCEKISTFKLLLGALL